MTETMSKNGNSTPTPRAFAVKFLVCFALLFGIFEASRGSAFERFVVEDLILVPTTALIDAATPNEHVQLKPGRVISSPGSNLHVTRGCEGIEMFLLLVAGIVAFPGSWAQRLHGLLVGSILAYVLSVTRLMSLHYILRYDAGAWEALHGLVLPLAPLMVMSIYFMHWSANAGPRPRVAAARAA